MSVRDWTPATADALVASACRRAALPHDNHELTRFGSNAVYRIDPGPVLLRLGPPGTDRGRWSRQLAVVDWLAKRKSPVIAPLCNEVYDLPGGALATFWPWFESDPSARRRPGEFGVLIRSIHDELAICPVAVGSWDALTRVRARLADALRAGRLGEREHRMLLACADRIDPVVSTADAGLGVGIVHGDAHTGNALSNNGVTVLTDFDGVAVAPRVWDLVPMAVSVARFGSPVRSLDEFMAGYGHDPRLTPEWRSFVRLRELCITVWLLGPVRHGKPTDREIAHRLEAWRSGDDQRRWNPF